MTAREATERDRTLTLTMTNAPTVWDVYVSDCCGDMSSRCDIFALPAQLLAPQAIQPINPKPTASTLVRGGGRTRLNPEKEIVLDTHSQLYGGSNANTAAPALMTHTETVTNSLQSLLASLNDTGSRLQESRDRMFGANPEVAGKDGPRSIPNGRADEIDMLLGACHTSAERNSSLAGELMRRL